MSFSLGALALGSAAAHTLTPLALAGQQATPRA